MKKLFSKRSGFTLVEIVVAFAVFAIMAAIIMQMMGLVVIQRQNNKDFSDSLSSQKENLVRMDKDREYDDSNKAGDLSIDFTDKDKNNVLNISMPYEMRAADGTKGNAEGINYFLSNVDYKSDGVSGGGSGGSGGGGSSSGSQTSRVDTRITGTKGFEKITIREVKKDPNTDGLESGQTRYLFKVSASTDDKKFADEDIPYAQYRLYFYDPDKIDSAASTKEYIDETTKKKYTKVVYDVIPIVEVGYLEENKSEYTVEKMGINSVRIGTPFKGTGVEFEFHLFSQFYIIFDGDPKLTAKSFGDNFILNTDGDTEYSRNSTLEKLADSPNIYGAFEYQKKFID